MTFTNNDWWRDAVIYQIYPRSFSDANGDGNGDLQGVIDRLDYLQALGVDALWLSPFYPSPLADGGYDVADYCDVDPRLGTLDQFDELVAKAHERGIGIIVESCRTTRPISTVGSKRPWLKVRNRKRHNGMCSGRARGSTANCRLPTG